jgi:hypothetical protein
VLATARQMIAAGVVVRGSCWDYANAVFRRAGFASGRKGKRRTIYRSRPRGPYASPRKVRPGDWLYLVNNKAILATHSVIFVHWVSRARRRAMVITYVGRRSNSPGYYRTYDVSRIFQIIRPKL